MSAADTPDTPDATARRRTFDEGLQAERTSLAWDRTALTIGGVGALLARAGGTSLPWAWPVAVAAFALAAALLLLARSRYVHRDASLRGEHAAPTHALIAVAGTAGVVISVASLAVVIGVAFAV
ncbi:MAG: DUF202 domain-containing protein [Nitriliruptor sp.]